jgi:hypothetical protein
MENRQVIPERNILRVDIMVAPLDFIAQMIQDNHWGYLYSCSYPVYPRLVRDFYRHLEVVQDLESGIILQTTIRGHIIRIDPRLIGSILDVPVLAISTNPFSEVLEPPRVEHIMDYFDAHPKGEKRAHLHIKIGAFSPLHRLLATIVLHNIWPTTCRSELVLKMARLKYALAMRMPFCLCKHILNTMIDMRDDHSTGLPFACLVTKICLHSVSDISAEPRIQVQDPLGS